MCFTIIAEKGMTDNTRNIFITKQLGEIIFDDVEVPIMAPLFQMICKRKWLANDPQATFKTASQGLLMFAFAQLSEDELATVNEHIKAFNKLHQQLQKKSKMWQRFLPKSHLIHMNL